MQFQSFPIPCFSFICCTFCISMCYHWLQQSRCTLHFFWGNIKGSEFRDFYLLNYVNYMPLIFLIKTRGSCVSSLASCEARAWIHSRWTVSPNLAKEFPPNSQKDGKKKSSAHNSFLRYDSKSVLPSIVCYFLLHPVPQLCNSSARPLKLDRSVKFFSICNFSCSFIQILLLAFFAQYLSLFNLHTIYTNISHLNSGTALLAAHFRDSIWNQSKWSESSEI